MSSPSPIWSLSGEKRKSESAFDPFRQLLSRICCCALYQPAGLLGAKKVLARCFMGPGDAHTAENA